MFGVSRKKSKPTNVRATASAESSDDDDDAHRSRIQQKQHERRKKSKGKGEKKKKKSKSASSAPMLSFDPEEGGVHDDDDAFLPMKSKKRKKHSKNKSGRGGGLGYGGAMAMDVASDGSSSAKMEKKDDDRVVDERDGGSYYDAAALQKLRLEQKRSTLVKDDTIKSQLPKYPAKEIKAMDIDEDHAEEEYIPLSSGGSTNRNTSSSQHCVADPVVLTGDDAIAYAEREEEENNVEFDHGLQSPPTPPPATSGSANEKAMAGRVADMDINANIMDVEQNDEEEEGNRRWEDNMARRAGVLPPNGTRTGDQNGRPRQRQRHATSSSISQIRTSLQPTIANLQNKHSDLETNIHRHESSDTATRDELTKHKKNLQKHGKALEYYQGLREDLATWTGALRELNGMVDKAEEAKRQLETEMSWRRMERFWQWGKDCTDVLENEGLLQKKLGGEDCTVESDNNDHATMEQVDEFGRDLSSMASLARTKRYNQRRERSLERLQAASHTDLNDPLPGRTNEDNIDSEEIIEWKQRHDALAQAMAIIPNLVKDDYLSLSNLCSLFFDWQQLYPEDYANCYAEMSLVQMLSVLVRLEMCERWDILDLHDTVEPSTTSTTLDVSEFKWFHDLKLSTAQQGDAGDKTTGKAKHKGILRGIIEKQIISRLLDTFSVEEQHRHGIYDPFSEKQTSSICSLLKSILGYLSEETVERILTALLPLMKFHINEMPVPIVDASKIATTGNELTAKGDSKGFDGETLDAIAYASIIQTKALCNLVKNIIGCWYPVFNQTLHHDQQREKVKALVQFVFVDLITNRILPILQSLHDIASCGSNETDEKYSALPKMFINDVLDALQGAGLLDKDEWMLLAAPLRVSSKQWADNSSS